MNEYRYEQSHDQVATERKMRQSVVVARQSYWSRSEHGVVKLDTFSASKDKREGVGLRIVARDDQGSTLQLWSVTRTLIVVQ